MKTIYEANDGTQFDNPEDCRAHEENIKKPLTWEYHTDKHLLVVYGINDPKQWQYGCFVTPSVANYIATMIDSMLEVYDVTPKAFRGTKRDPLYLRSLLCMALAYVEDEAGSECGLAVEIRQILGMENAE